MENEKDAVDEAIQRSLDYVLDEMGKAVKEVEEEGLDATEYTRRLSKALSLRLRNEGPDFDCQNRKANRKMLNFMNDLKDHF